MGKSVLQFLRKPSWNEEDLYYVVEERDSNKFHRTDSDDDNTRKNQTRLLGIFWKADEERIKSGTRTV